jgi:hypothetical protein
MPIYKAKKRISPIEIDQKIDYKEINYALYAELKRKFGKLNITAGLRMEDLQYKQHHKICYRFNADRCVYNLFRANSRLYSVFYYYYYTDHARCNALVRSLPSVLLYSITAIIIVAAAVGFCKY